MMATGAPRGRPRSRRWRATPLARPSISRWLYSRGCAGSTRSKMAGRSRSRLRSIRSPRLVQRISETPALIGSSARPNGKGGGLRWRGVLHKIIVTGDLEAARKGPQLRALAAAARLRQRAAGVEGAAGRRIERARQLALQNGL